ncbi:hypothetical protein PP713_03245 [Mycobacterium sp. CSUR Q5927]|nr:hypothetical protein [Mycobacterium sp. CSUR Q5927]
MAELDIAKLRAAAAELGYWPATTDDEHLDKLRADNERFDRMHPHRPPVVHRAKMTCTTIGVGSGR